MFFVFCISSNNRSSHRRCSVKNGVLRNFARFTGKHLCQVSFLIKLQAESCGTGVFLWILRNFLEHLFYRTPRDDCFCNKLNSILCGICLSFKTRHLELFCKIIIQLFYTGIFLELWLRVPPCNFREQQFFLHSCEWLLPII